VSGTATHHYEVALGIAYSFSRHDEQFWDHYNLAGLSLDRRRFNDAHPRLERAKSYTSNQIYFLGCAVGMQAMVWCWRRGPEEARSEALRALNIFGRLGATEDAETAEGSSSGSRENE
jgi:hypothetical protein